MTDVFYEKLYLGKYDREIGWIVKKSMDYMGSNKMNRLSKVSDLIDGGSLIAIIGIIIYFLAGAYGIEFFSIDWPFIASGKDDHCP